ncbi:hypothetical protein IQ06DRAFT_108362 [Phaeosphaeriaceae sp. SRC1lsM3a]|nr:hypothetical protein IQ06DRAFT_108362 [Stagonospora sp. SRC1lsM3a]
MLSLPMIICYLTLLSRLSGCTMASSVHSLAQSSNTTQFVGSSTQLIVGWRDSSGERGTLEILWTCFTTVIACTWTILHLNVPGMQDGAWTKFWRKVKWMAITIVFPEFTFAKAVCELQMAVEDLHELSLQQDKFSYRIEYGLGCRLLHKLLRPRASTCTGSRKLSLELTKDSIKKEPREMASQTTSVQIKQHFLQSKDLNQNS